MGALFSGGSAAGSISSRIPFPFEMDNRSLLTHF